MTQASVYISYSVVAVAAIAVIYVIVWSIKYRSVITVSKRIKANGDSASHVSDISSCYDTESQTQDHIYFTQSEEEIDDNLQTACAVHFCTSLPIAE